MELEDELVNNMEAIEEAQERRLNFIRSLSAEELKDEFEDMLDATDVVVEGVGMASARSTGDGILLTAVMKLRDMIEAGLIWLEEKHPTPDLEEAEEAAKAVKSAAKKEVKPKRSESLSIGDEEEL